MGNRRGFLKWSAAVAATPLLAKTGGAKVLPAGLPISSPSCTRNARKNAARRSPSARPAAVRIVGAQPSEGSRIPGIRKWPEAYLPKIHDPKAVDELVYVSQADAETMARRLAAEEGLFCGISAAGACWVALQIAQRVENATIVFIVCDRGDRYLSTGVFPA